MKAAEEAVKYLEDYRKRIYNPINLKTKEFNPKLTTIHYFYVYVKAINIAIKRAKQEVKEEHKKIMEKREHTYQINLECARQGAKQEVFDDIENKCSIWTTNDIAGSSETKAEDKWLSMNIIKKLKKKHNIK